VLGIVIFLTNHYWSHHKFTFAITSKNFFKNNSCLLHYFVAPILTTSTILTIFFIFAFINHTLLSYNSHSSLVIISCIVPWRYKLQISHNFWFYIIFCLLVEQKFLSIVKLQAKVFLSILVICVICELLTLFSLCFCYCMCSNPRGRCKCWGFFHVIFVSLFFLNFFVFFAIVCVCLIMQVFLSVEKLQVMITSLWSSCLYFCKCLSICLCRCFFNPSWSYKW